MIEFTPRQLKVNFIPRKSQNTGELCVKFTISSIYFHVDFFQSSSTMWLEYVIKYSLFTRK